MGVPPHISVCTLICVEEATRNGVLELGMGSSRLVTRSWKEAVRDDSKTSDITYWGDCDCINRNKVENKRQSWTIC